MENLFVPARDAETYENLRRSFVDADQKPKMSELAEKFNIPIGTVYRRASEEQWNEQRAARLQKLELEGDAKALIVSAANRVDATVMRAFSEVVLVSLQALTVAIQRIPEDQAASTQVQTISGASFAFLNLANGCKALGIVGFAKELGQLGKEANGRWNPEMLQQINVTVQNLQAQAEGGKVAPTAAPAPKPAQAEEWEG